MKRLLLIFVAFLLVQIAFAQVGIGTETPNRSSQLDVVSADRGILIPRVALQSTTDQVTIRNGNVNSLMVFNTNTANDISPGYYYWFEEKWYKIATTTDFLEETITTLIEEENGTFVYTSENGTQTIIDIPEAIINEIINRGDIYQEILNLIDANQTVTILQDNGNGTYTYFNEEDVDADGVIIGPGVTIDVVGDVVTNILNQGDIYDQIINLIEIQSDVFIDNGDGTFTHTSVDGQTVVFDANTTSMTDNGDGTYTFTNDNGETMTITGVETLTFLALNADGKTLEYTDEDGVVTTIDLEEIIQNFETLTTIIANTDDGTFTYTDEDGQETVIDISDLETLTSIALNPDNTNINYTDEDGNVTQLDLTDLVRNLETTVSIEDGVNTTVESVVTDNHTEYRVNVATAEGTNLGVVKEAADNPTVSINEDGELSVNLENLNAVVHTAVDYFVSLSDMTVLGNADANDINIQLPDPTEVPRGKKYTIKKLDTNEANYIYVIGNIAGVNGEDLYTAIPYTGWDFISDGTIWHIVNAF